MKISTRSRYGLRFMTVLARHYGRGLLHLKEIAREEDISEKYLSLLVMPLKASGLVITDQGAHGGYQLARPPRQITVRQIIEPLEGGINLVECSRNPGYCRRSSACCTQDVWTVLEEKIRDTLDKMTLDKLIKE